MAERAGIEACDAAGWEMLVDGCPHAGRNQSAGAGSSLTEKAGWMPSSDALPPPPPSISIESALSTLPWFESIFQREREGVALHEAADGFRAITAPRKWADIFTRAICPAVSFKICPNCCLSNIWNNVFIWRGCTGCLLDGLMPAHEREHARSVPRRACTGCTVF